MIKKFIFHSIDFIIKHWIEITVTMVVLFFIISYIVVNDIQLVSPKHLKGSSIVVEEFTNPNDIFRKGFCKSQLGDSRSLEKNCNNLSEKACNLVNCCVYAHNPKGSKCVAGKSFHGPTFKSDTKGNMYNYDYWYYLGKKYP